MDLNKYTQQMIDKGYTPGSEAARRWLLGKIKQASIDRYEFVNESKSARPKVGNMYMFNYNAGIKYYDRFPMIYLTSLAKDGFYGINVHYLRPTERIALFDNNGKLDNSNRLLKYAIKRYLTRRVAGNIVKIPEEDWDVAIMIPSDLWENTTRASVYRRR